MPHSSSLPALGAKHSSGVGIGEWASGAAGVPSEIWVLYLLFHIGSWKGKPIPASIVV